MKIIPFKILQSEFNNVLNTVPQKIFLIDNELKEIDNYLSINENEYIMRSSLTSGMGGMIKPRTTNIFRLEIKKYDKAQFIESFKSYLVYGKFELVEFPNEMEEHTIRRKEVIKQAEEFANYYKWLIELKENNPKTINNKKPSLSHKQKMLALHYLGLNLSKYDNVKTAKILSQILDLGEENTRKYLSYLIAGKNEVRTKLNLEKVSQLFENSGITEVSSKINLEIENLK